MATTQIANEIPLRERMLVNLEPWIGNQYYGIGAIYKRYARLSWWHPLNCRLQHGVKLWTMYKSPMDLPEEIAFYIPPCSSVPFLTYKPEHAEFFTKHGFANVHAIGAPVVYMQRFIKKCSEGTPRKGTIAFPCKSTHFADVTTDYSEYAELLLQLPDKFKPIKVCMYYLDIDKGRDLPFLDRGLDVVCNGKLLSQRFLYHFYDNCAGYRYATSNDVLSSPVFYSIFGGLRFFEYGPGIRFNSTANMHSSYGRERELGAQTSPHRFPIDKCDDYKDQLLVAEAELGIPAKRSPSELRQLMTERWSRKMIRRNLSHILPRYRVGRIALRMKHILRRNRSEI